MDLKLFKISENWSDFSNFCKKRVTGTKSGLDVLDRHTLGLRNLTCIRGGPGTNKSTLALQISKYYAENHGPVIFYDRENGINRIRMRLICQDGNFSEVEVVKPLVDYSVSEERVKKLPYYVISEISLEDIEAVMDDLIVKNCGSPMLVIDSIQKLPINLENRRDNLDKWVVGLDLLKVKYENKAKIIFISEKSKSSYANSDMSGSKDTGSIEYSSELIIDLQDNKKEGNVICTIVKDRDGPQGYSFNLKRILSNPENERSFCYKLEEDLSGF